MTAEEFLKFQVEVGQCSKEIAKSVQSTLTWIRENTGFGECRNSGPTPKYGYMLTWTDRDWYLEAEWIAGQIEWFYRAGNNEPIERNVSYAEDPPNVLSVLNPRLLVQ